MATKHINTSNLPPDLQMNKNQDKLEITIDASCVWCFKDDDGVFGNPSTLLPCNTYYVSGPTSYGTMTAVKAGQVSINVSQVGTPCIASKESKKESPLTGHTITVTG
jgi:hypothetical protein